MGLLTNPTVCGHPATLLNPIPEESTPEATADTSGRVHQNGASLKKSRTLRDSMGEGEAKPYLPAAKLQRGETPTFTALAERLDLAALLVSSSDDETDPDMPGLEDATDESSSDDSCAQILCHATF